MPPVPPKQRNRGWGKSNKARRRSAGAVIPRPRGRGPNGKAWDGRSGKWIAAASAAAAATRQTASAGAPGAMAPEEHQAIAAAGLLAMGDEGNTAPEPAVDVGSERRVVVTGCSGRIGKACVAELHRRGWLVIGLDVHQPPPSTRALLCDRAPASRAPRAPRAHAARQCRRRAPAPVCTRMWRGMQPAEVPSCDRGGSARAPLCAVVWGRSSSFIEASCEAEATVAALAAVKPEAVVHLAACPDEPALGSGADFGSSLLGPNILCVTGG